MPRKAKKKTPVKPPPSTPTPNKSSPHLNQQVIRPIPKPFQHLIEPWTPPIPTSDISITPSNANSISPFDINSIVLEMALGVVTGFTPRLGRCPDLYTVSYYKTSDAIKNGDNVHDDLGLDNNLVDASIHSSTPTSTPMDIDSTQEPTSTDTTNNNIDATTPNDIKTAPENKDNPDMNTIIKTNQVVYTEQITEHEFQEALKIHKQLKFPTLQKLSHISERSSFYTTTVSQRQSTYLNTKLTSDIIWKLVILAAMEIQWQHELKTLIAERLAEIETEESAQAAAAAAAADASKSKDGKQDQRSTEASLPLYYTKHPTTFLGAHYPGKRPDSLSTSTSTAKSPKSKSKTSKSTSKSTSKQSAAKKKEEEYLIHSLDISPSQISSRIKNGIYKVMEYSNKMRKKNGLVEESIGAGAGESSANAVSMEGVRKSNRIAKSSDKVQQQIDAYAFEEEEEEEESCENHLPPVNESGSCIALYLIQLLKFYPETEFIQTERLGNQVGTGGEIHVCAFDMEEKEKNLDEKPVATDMDVDVDETAENASSEAIDSYFKPTSNDILTALSKHKESLLPTDIKAAIEYSLEESIPLCLPIIRPLDLSLEQVRDSLLTPDVGASTTTTTNTLTAPAVGRGATFSAMLACTSGEKLKALQKMDPSTFSRCKFQLSVIQEETPNPSTIDDATDMNGEGVVPELSEEEQLKIQQDLEQQRQEELEQERIAVEKYRADEKAWRMRKQYETWRYHSVQGSLTFWPKWTDYVVKVLKSQRSSMIAVNGHADGVSTSTSMEVSNSASTTDADAIKTSTTAIRDVSQETKDAEIAQALAMEETNTPSETTVQRRTTRRAAAVAANEKEGGKGASGNVIFYGSSQTMSTQQLVEAIQRLVVNAWPRPMSLLDLKRVLLDEGSSSTAWTSLSLADLKKVRMALGKLTFRLGKIDRIIVNLESDSICWDVLREEKKNGGSLLSLELLSKQKIAMLAEQKKYSQAKVVVSHVKKETPVTPTGTKEEMKVNGTPVKMEDAMMENEEKSSDQPDQNMKPESTENASESKEEVNDVKMDDNTGKDSPGESLAIKAEDDATKLSSTDSTDAATVPQSVAQDDPRMKEELEVLQNYMKSLHFIELTLRSLLLRMYSRKSGKSIGFQHITPVMLAMTAEEGENDLESFDSKNFPPTSTDPVEWDTSTTHPLLGKLIYRPAKTDGKPSSGDYTTPCSWFKVDASCPSVALEPTEEATAVKEGTDADGKDTAIENKLVQQRIRFRAVPSSPNGTELKQNEEGASIILTEGQVYAGICAAELEMKNQQQKSLSTRSKSTDSHPFTKMIGMGILLYQSSNTEQDMSDAIRATLAGQDRVLSQDGKNVINRALILLDDESQNDDASSVFWARVSDDATTIHRLDSDISYTIEAQEYHNSTPAYEACESILQYLKAHVKIMPFMTPVNPVELGIPEYFTIIKNPMDILTVEKKLSEGKYGRIPPGGEYESSIGKMLHGPFYDDIMLIFDNALLFNTPGDWIHNDAGSLKRLTSKKIETISNKAERTALVEGGPTSSARKLPAKKKSVYVDEDSDVDMYEFESDYDEEDDFASGKKKKSRKRKLASSSKVEDYSTRAIEAPIHLPTSHLDSTLFSNLPISSNVDNFGLPTDWSCRHVSEDSDTQDEDMNNIDEVQENELQSEKDKLMLLQLQFEQENTAIGGATRRSARSHTSSAPTQSSENGHQNHGSNNGIASLKNAEYFHVNKTISDSNKSSKLAVATSRAEIESNCEMLHEEYYAKLYYKYCSQYATEPAEVNPVIDFNDCGIFSEGGFPPYLGRITPSQCAMASKDENQTLLPHIKWEIRSPYIISALRYVIRGLIQSDHLAEWEPLFTIDGEVNNGAVVCNHSYYHNVSKAPFEVLDVKEMQRRKRSENEKTEEEEEEQVELSEYEKMRAMRVARNQDRLKMLGLAS